MFSISLIYSITTRGKIRGCYTISVPKVYTKLMESCFLDPNKNEKIPNQFLVQKPCRKYSRKNRHSLSVERYFVRFRAQKQVTPCELATVRRSVTYAVSRMTRKIVTHGNATQKMQRDENAGSRSTTLLVLPRHVHT